MFKGRLRVLARVGPLLFVEGYKDHSTNIFALVLKIRLRVKRVASQESNIFNRKCG